MVFKKVKHIETYTTAKNYTEITKEHQLWRNQRETKTKIFKKYDELISMLEESLDVFTNDVERRHVRKQIQKLKKIRDMYDVPSILSTRLESIEEKPVLKIKKR